MSAASTVSLDSGLCPNVLSLDCEDTFSVLLQPSLLPVIGQEPERLSKAFMQCLQKFDQDAHAIKVYVKELVTFLMTSDGTSGAQHHVVTTAARFAGDEGDCQFEDVHEQPSPYNKHIVAVTEVGKNDITINAVPLAGCAFIMQAVEYIKKQSGGQNMIFSL